jgi:putative ABC transport system permease protein
VVDARLKMEGRMLWASLWQRRGTAALAALAVAIGASVAAALLHVSGDVGAKLTRELRSLGPNLVIAPADPGGQTFLEESHIRERLTAAGVTGLPVLYATALLGDRAIPIAGADPFGLVALHPSWKRSGSVTGGQLGAALARRLDVRPGERLTLASPDGRREIAITIGGVFESGGADEEALWMPLEEAQGLTGLHGFVSLVQARVEGGPDRVDRVAAELSRGGGISALPLHALTATEQGLLDRMRRLMLLVTLAALFAGALSAYGTLTDLALERRREIALLKAVGAPRRRIVGRFLAESVAIGVAGGVLGWTIGAAFALLIGRQVFHATLTLQPGVPLKVLALATATALLAAAGPIRLALAIEPARALREDG